ncbi:Sterol O-acyltransferase 2 [Ceratocystis fimbriata CBS 114723]|uniref:Sterol O-acyltransferase 2 n=1 Tax=Ceratocystis fimbriata CBS 114723 TaxID=1035309 RepID=A0A2C5X115_9PEZI|nr:Sterol O-acyltransferase 2 [Ceratocystis fimbriata CBS 114723]
MEVTTRPDTPPTTPPQRKSRAVFATPFPSSSSPKNSPSLDSGINITMSSTTEATPDTFTLRHRKPDARTEALILSEDIDVSVTNNAGNTKDLSDDEKHVLLQSTELRDVIKSSLQNCDGPKKVLKRGKFRDLIFTKQFSAFDGQNDSAANSPFIGFFNLFWMSVFMYMLKIVVLNISIHGNPLGTHEIISTMVSRDLVYLGLADGVMCALTLVSWGIQRIMFAGYLNWDRSGWLLQHAWQVFFIVSVVGLTLYREWPWTHTVFFVLHGLTMLMKQHAYSFYNGYLSAVYYERASLIKKLKELEAIAPSHKASNTAPAAADIDTTHLAENPHPLPAESLDFNARRVHNSHDQDLQAIAAAIDSGEPLDLAQISTYKQIIKWEIDALTEELKGRATVPERMYPNNLTLKNALEWVALPTLVYELEYPRSNKINWRYVAVKVTAVFGIIFVMILISQHFIYPVFSQAIAMKEANVPVIERFKVWPSMLSDLMFPFVMEYLLTWYLIWETILNVLAELTYFADRSFYDAWWNSVSWDQFARDWNRPVHNFLLRHVYHSSQASMGIGRYTATIITFFLSACVHELVMWCLFKKLRGYLLIMQMFQIPLVSLHRSRFLKGRKTLNNLIFWLGIFTGPSLLGSLYIIL